MSPDRSRCLCRHAENQHQPDGCRGAKYCCCPLFIAHVTIPAADLDAIVARVAELEADNARMREALDRASAAAYDIAIGADLARTEPERSADSLEAALGDIEKRAQHAGGLARKALGREP